MACLYQVIVAHIGNNQGTLGTTNCLKDCENDCNKASLPDPLDLGASFLKCLFPSLPTDWKEIVKSILEGVNVAL